MSAKTQLATYLAKLLFKLKEGVAVPKNQAIPLRQRLRLLYKGACALLQLRVPLVDDVINCFALRIAFMLLALELNGKSNALQKFKAITVLDGP